MRRHEPSITINQVCIIKTQNGEENNVRDKKNRDKAKFETSTLKNLSIVSYTSVQPIPSPRCVLRESLISHRDISNRFFSNVLSLAPRLVADNRARRTRRA